MSITTKVAYEDASIEEGIAIVNDDDPSSFLDEALRTFNLGSPVSPTSAPTALVVDDDHEICEMLLISLSLEGFRVRTTGDGASALGILDREKPDVILLDVMMPELDGYEVIRRLRQGETHRATPVIMLSAKVTDEDVWEGWKVGADSYITKPLDLDVLLSEIERVTSGGDRS